MRGAVLFWTALLFFLCAKFITMEKQISNSTFAADIIRGKWLLADAAAYLPTVFALLSRVPLGLRHFRIRLVRRPDDLSARLL